MDERVIPEVIRPDYRHKIIPREALENQGLMDFVVGGINRLAKRGCTFFTVEQADNDILVSGWLVEPPLPNLPDTGYWE